MAINNHGLDLESRIVLESPGSITSARVGCVAAVYGAVCSAASNVVRVSSSIQAWGSLFHSGQLMGKKEWRCWVELVGKCLNFRLWLFFVLECLSIMYSTGTTALPFIIRQNRESLTSRCLSFNASQPRSSNIRKSLVVRPKSWEVNRAALLCTASKLLICFLRWGSQTAAAYSRLDLMSDIWALSRNSMGQPARLQCNSPKVLVYELVTCYICVSRSMSQLDGTPRYLVSLAWHLTMN